MAVEETVTFSDHANVVIDERGLDRDWVVRTVREPEWTSPDPNDPGLERRFRAIPEFGDRWLRVVVREDERGVHVVSCFFDRRARRPK